MMDRTAVYVTWTMDCEDLDQESPTGGPAAWELSARAMTGYVQTLTERGHAVTLFLIPRVAEVQAGLLADLRDAGADMGMHMHPQNRDIGIDDYLGRLSRQDEEQLLRAGRDRITGALGEAPVSFRAGNFSGSDDTHPVLASLGFVADSTPLPGRVMPDLGAQWHGAEPFAHRASATDRLSAGELPLLVCPTAVDLRDVSAEGAVPREARHLRLERPGICEWGPEIVAAHLGRQVELDLPLKSLVVMTHNVRDYADSAEPAREGLEAVLAAVQAVSADLGLAVRGITLAELARVALAEKAC